jgi:nitrate/nitrite transport system substrate-binding protein
LNLSTFFAGGSDAPERRTVRVGFLPLTDCAPVVMASVLGLDEKYGIRIVLSREASWSSVRDRLCRGELDAAHALYGLMTGVQLGIGAVRHDLAILMGLSWNGQAITLSRALAQAGVRDGPSLRDLLDRDPQPRVFGHTFPTGNHAMLLYYWLGAAGIDPFDDVRAVTVPPPQMAQNLAAGHMDGFCSGEPWGERAVRNGAGFTAATSQQVWQDHPGKVLGTTGAFADSHPHTCRALIAAVLEAARWIDASPINRQAVAEVLASPAYVDTPREIIAPRLLGHYEDGLDSRWKDNRALTFHAGGQVNFPYLSDAMWFMTQYRRWGLAGAEPDYLAAALALNRIDLYREAAELAHVPTPAEPMRKSRLMDGVVWDGADPARYAASFAVRR